LETLAAFIVPIDGFGEGADSEEGVCGTELKVELPGNAVLPRDDFPDVALVDTGVIDGTARATNVVRLDTVGCGKPVFEVVVEIG